MTAEVATTKNQVVHNPLLRFRQGAHCKNCELHRACLSDKEQEKSCILALIADSLHTLTKLNTPRGTHQ